MRHGQLLASRDAMRSPTRSRVRAPRKLGARIRARARRRSRPHAAECDVDDEGASPSDFELRVEAVGAPRYVRELDALALAVAAACVHLHTLPGLEPKRRIRFTHLDHPSRAARSRTQIVFEPDIRGYSVGSMMM